MTDLSLFSNLGSTDPNGVCRVDDRRCCEPEAWPRSVDANYLRFKNVPTRWQNAQTTPSGFTLIELLIVIGIIGILISMMLPAVQSVREAARKTACKNKLRQIGIALHAYENAHGNLPMGCLEWRAWDSPSSHRQFAWSAMLLPFLEQQAVYDRIDWTLPFDATQNAEAAQSNIGVYVCPSKSMVAKTPGRISFGGLHGERIVDPEPDDGIFLHERAIEFREIRDGLSHTIAVAEDVGGPDSQWINGRNVFVQSHGINDPAAWVGDNEIRSAHPGGAMLIFADGRATFMSESIENTLLGQLITRSKGEVAQFR